MKIFFLGIGGVAMGNAAILAKQLGHDVSGCDRGLYDPMLGQLKKYSVPFEEQFSLELLKKVRPDLIVIGNAISRGNPIAEWILNINEIPFLSLPQFLHDFIMKDRRRIVISGTHGKTTTTALSAFYMQSLGIDGGYFIGGVPEDFPFGAALGEAKSPFAIEGDEYDSAFFDKRSKFIHYFPHTLIINRIDFDHADIFRDLQDVQRSFSHLLRIVPENGCVFLNGDDDNSLALLPVPWTHIFRVGEGKNNDFRLGDFSMQNGEFSWILRSETRAVAMVSKLPGKFNAMNASMAILAVHETLQIPLPEHIDLRAFHGVRRRQQMLFKSADLLVMEDFGHHPRAVGEMLEWAKTHHSDREIWAIFEPATNTSMRRALQEDFAAAFLKCDRCFWGTPRNWEAIPPSQRLEVERVMEILNGKIKEARSFSENRQLMEHLLGQLAKLPAQKRLLLIFSNSAFPEVLPYWRNYAQRASEKSSPKTVLENDSGREIATKKPKSEKRPGKK